MTVSSTNRKTAPFLGDGSTGPFNFDFYMPVGSESSVVAVVADPNGAETTLDYGDPSGPGVDYTVSLNNDQSNNPGGSVTLTDVLPVGYKLVLTSAVPGLQPTDITNLGGFYQELVTQAFDRVTVLVQQADEKINRAVKVPISSTITPDDLINQLTNAASDAVNAAGAAAVSEGNAAASASAALTSEGNAHDSEVAAALSEGNAATSEGNAAASASAALTSENNAHDSEVAAGLSAGAAAVSEGKAHDSELAAALSEDNAADSAGAALASQNAAHDSEVAAASSELAAKTYLETLVQPFAFMKADYDTPCLKKTGAQTVSIKAGTVVVVAGVARAFAADTPVTMPALTAGEDYSVWVKTDNSAVAVVDSFLAPASAPDVGAIRIGGFHHGLVAPGETVAGGSFSTSGVTAGGGSMLWTQADVDKLAGINEFSIWDLALRHRGEQYGMSYDPWVDAWGGIYFCNTAPHLNGISRYNTDVCSGTVQPFVPPSFGGDGVLKYSAFRSWEAIEILADHGCRPVLYNEFVSMAFGVTEGQSLGGASATIPATARQPGYTSRIGLEQATGHVYTIGGPMIGQGGSAWAGNGRGSNYGGGVVQLFGGNRSITSSSGSRCVSFDAGLAYSDWSVSLRAAGDPQKTVGPALYQEAA